MIKVKIKTRNSKKVKPTNNLIWFPTRTINKIYSVDGMIINTVRMKMWISNTVRMKMWISNRNSRTPQIEMHIWNTIQLRIITKYLKLIYKITTI